MSLVSSITTTKLKQLQYQLLVTSDHYLLDI